MKRVSTDMSDRDDAGREQGVKGIRVPRLDVVETRSRSSLEGGDERDQGTDREGYG